MNTKQYGLKCVRTWQSERELVCQLWSYVLLQDLALPPVWCKSKRKDGKNRFGRKYVGRFEKGHCREIKKFYIWNSLRERANVLTSICLHCCRRVQTSADMLCVQTNFLVVTDEGISDLPPGSFPRNPRAVMMGFSGSKGFEAPLAERQRREYQIEKRGWEGERELRQIIRHYF